MTSDVFWETSPDDNLLELLPVRPAQLAYDNGGLHSCGISDNDDVDELAKNKNKINKEKTYIYL